MRLVTRLSLSFDTRVIQFFANFSWFRNVTRRPLGRLALLVAFGLAVTAAQAREYRVYIGTYTDKSSEGIYAFDFDSTTGKTGPVRLVARAANPSFLALHPTGRTLYAVNELVEYEGAATGAVTAYRIDSDGILEALNQKPTGGGAPCHLVVDQTGGSLLIANYVGGNVAVLDLLAGGELGRRTELIQHLGSSVNPRRQTEPHAHSINLDGANRFAAAADLGVDKVFVYPFDAETGRLDLARSSSVALKPGAGPRHFAFHPNGRLAVTNNELHSTLTSLRYEAATGTLSVLETASTLPEGYSGGNSTAEARIHPNGRFAYVSNRGHNSIAVFELNPSSGQLKRVELESTQGKTPRNFGLDPEGRYLFAANQGSDSVVIFRIDAETGKLTPTGEIVDVPTPVCVKFWAPGE